MVSYLLNLHNNNYFFRHTEGSIGLLSIHKPILFLDKYCHGNFSPGSFFLSGAISECPKIFSGFREYLKVREEISLFKEDY